MTVKKEECGCHLAGLNLTGTNVQCPCRALLEKELESVGIRLNKSKPNIYFKVSFPGLLEAQLVSGCLMEAKGNVCCPLHWADEAGSGFWRLFLS